MNASERPTGKVQQELEALRARVAELERAEADLRRSEATREQAEEALRKSEERYRLLAEAAQDYILVVNRHDIVEYANTYAAAQLGKTPADLVGRNIREFFPPQVAERMSGNLHAVIQSGQAASLEGVVPFPGRITWLGTRLVPLRTQAGEIQSVLVVSRDITSAKQTEEALRSSEAQLHEQFSELEQIYHYSPVGLCVLDRDLRYLRINERLARLDGKSVDEHLHRSVYEMVPDLAERIEQVCRLVWERGEAVSDVELRGRAPRSGGQRHYLASFLPLRSPSGEVTRLLCSVIDITERKRAEEERERLNLRLREAHKLEAVGRFGRGVAHDFNNLMATVVGLASNMKSKRKPGDPEHAKLTQIEEAAETAAKLALQLLDFAKGGKIRPQVLSFSGVVKSALTLIPPILPHNVKLASRLKANSWLVECDQTQIQQVILNLCRNALEAMPKGGRLTIRTHHATLASSLNDAQPPLAAGEYVCLSVEDTGCGMDEETMKCIFDPFFTTKDGGHGLGLAAAYGVVAAHGGSISVQSTPNGGSTFRLWLPRAKTDKC